LVQRRQAIAAAELVEEMMGSSSGGSGSGSGGGGGGRSGGAGVGDGDGEGSVEETKKLREAVSLQLERLRTLRWRELILEASLAGAC
jgi:hypothetical protein